MSTKLKIRIPPFQTSKDIKEADKYIFCSGPKNRCHGSSKRSCQYTWQRFEVTVTFDFEICTMMSHNTEEIKWIDVFTFTYNVFHLDPEDISQIDVCSALNFKKWDF